MVEGTADLTTGGNPMPNLRMAKRLESIAKHGTRTSTRMPQVHSKTWNKEKHQSHSKAWTESIQPNNKWVEGQEHCPDELFQRLHGWEKQKLHRASRAYKGATTKAQLKDQSEMVATLTAQNKDPKRKVGAVDICLGHTKKAQRSSTNNNYESVFVADDANEDEM